VTNKQLADELAQRVAERGTDFYVLVNEAEALDLASGYVPLSVRGMVRAMLDFQEDDRRRAERPIRKKKSA
jgi:hypothetical protein